MNFIANAAPNYRSKRSTTKIMVILMAALALVWGASIIFNFTKMNVALGISSILIVLVAQIATAVADIAMLSIRYRKTAGHYGEYLVDGWLKNYSYVTAMIFALCLPAWTPLYVVAVGSLFATIIGKYVFGGFGQNIFNPAAIGRIFVTISFAGTLIPPAGLIATTGSTVTTFLSNLGPKWGLADLSASGLNMSDLWLGLYPGALGETFTLLILAIGVALAILKVINWRTPAFYLGTVAITAGFIAVFTQQPILEYMLMHLSLGGLMFGAVFMLTDPVTGPTSPFGKALAGVIAGLVTVLIRIQGGYPEGVVFAIVLTNMISPVIDHFATGLTNQHQLRKWLTVGAVALVSVALNSTLASAHYQTYAFEQREIANTYKAIGLTNHDNYTINDAQPMTDAGILAKGITSSSDVMLNGAEPELYGVVYDGSLALYDGTIDFKVGMVERHYVGFVLERSAGINALGTNFLTSLPTLMVPANEIKVLSTVAELKTTLSAGTEATPLLEAFVAASSDFATRVPQAEVFMTFEGQATSEYDPEHSAGETTTTAVTVSVDRFMHLIDLTVAEPTSGGGFATTWTNNWAKVKAFYLSKTVAEIQALTEVELATSDGAVTGLTYSSNRLLAALHDAFKDVSSYLGSATSEYDPEHSAGVTTTTTVAVYVNTSGVIIALDIVSPTSGGGFQTTYLNHLEAILALYVGKTVTKVKGYTTSADAGLAETGVTYTVDRILLAVQNALVGISG